LKKDNPGKHSHKEETDPLPKSKPPRLKFLRSAAIAAVVFAMALFI